jgi:cytochrome P450/NADPH-cytochrome P450 reductase
MNGSSTGAKNAGFFPVGAVRPLVVESAGSRWSLEPGGSYLIGRDPGCSVVLADVRVSRRHAVVRVEGGRWEVADAGSANGIYRGGLRVQRIAITAGCVVRLVDPDTGPVLRFDPGASEQVPDDSEESTVRLEKRSPASPSVDDAPSEIPYAIRWLVPNGERFANFDILNDNDTQLEYFRRFGHVYAVGVPARKWRLVLVSDPDLLERVATDEEQFGKRVEAINFFDQLRNSRGGGLSVIGDGEHYERVRRVMLPWYSPAHQRTQLDLMKAQAGKMMRAWAELPDEQPLEARGWMERYTLEVSGRGACAYDFGLLAGDGTQHAFAAAVPASTKESIRRVADPRPDSLLFVGRAGRARRKTYRQHNEELFRTADALVHARRHTCPAGEPIDLLSRLISTPDPETGELLDTETVRDQILMHLSNGFNGPSITAAWLVAVLATRPDVEARLIAEIDGITGGDPRYDLRYDDLANLTYTTQVIKEALRVYPPMPITIRRSLKDGLLGRYTVRKGDVILVGALAAHRDTRFWGPDPDRFDPEHFTPERIAERPVHAFIPFSIGRRQCMAQEVSFMMLRVLLFEIYRRYRLRLAPGATVAKNTVVTTKPEAFRVTRIPRTAAAPPTVVVDQPPDDPAWAPSPDRGAPTEIPATSAYRHLVIAYGSNFGASKELAERFAERSDFHGYTTEVLTLDELAASPARAEPWLLVVMTSTYTGNPPSNATAFRKWIEAAAPGSPVWRECRYLVWGLGNRQWNAFLAFPRYVHRRLGELGASPLADLDFADVGSTAWEARHEAWNGRVWPTLLDLSGARPTEAAATRAAQDDSVTTELTGSDSITAMRRSLSAQPPDNLDVLTPTIFDNPVGAATQEARLLTARELQSATSSRRTRHLEIALPAGSRYLTGDHLGVCPRNDPEDVERLARHLGVSLDGVFTVPKALPVRAVPKGVVVQVRNVLTNLVDIGAKPTVALVDVLRRSATETDERSRLAEIVDVLRNPEGPPSALRAAIDAGGYDLLRLLDDFPSVELNIFQLLCVAQPLRPRYYSISSCPAVHGPDVAHLTVGLETAVVPGEPDRHFHGRASHYLHRLRPGDQLAVFLDSADGFHLQDDTSKPMIFVSAGTGFAPMRAFLWERLARLRGGATLGQAVLFNGLRSPRVDGLYQDEIDRFVAAGVLDHVHIAASRDDLARREHVQDRIRQQGYLVWRLLAEGAYTYVCGAQRMRDAVRAAFVDVIAEHGTMPSAGAETLLAELEKAGRYRPDLWG